MAGRAGALLLFLLALPLGAQEVATPELRGVVRGGASAPIPGAMVVLHRVDAVEAGEIDSLRAGPLGDFRFSLPTVPDPGGRGEVYFASVRHQGVLYFGPAIAAAVDLDSLYTIQVHDTVVAPPGGSGLAPTVRYLLAEEVEGGWQVTDLFQITVRGDRTWVAADSGLTWRYPLPPGHRDLQVGGGDIPPATTRVQDGMLEVTAPLPPGPRQLVVRYTLDSLTVDIPVPGGVEEMDFLVRDPAPSLEVRGLVPAESVELEPGVRYRRFAGAGVPDTVIQVRTLPPEFQFPTRWLAVALGLLLAGVGVYAVQRGAPAREPSSTGEAPAPPTREELVQQVAELDLTLAETSPGPERSRLQAQRERLVAELRRRS